MTITVGSDTEEDLAALWLASGGNSCVGRDGARTYPRRADLRRAEARAAATRRRPVSFLTEVELEPAKVLAPDLSVQQSRVQDPRSRRLSGTTTRLLVMALVVGAEGVAVPHLTDVLDADDTATAAVFAADDLQEPAPELAPEPAQELAQEQSGADYRNASRAAAKAKIAAAQRKIEVRTAKPQPKAPQARKLVVRTPIVKKPLVRKPLVKKPPIGKPLVKKPPVTKPVARKPVISKPIVRKPAVKKPLVRKPVEKHVEKPAEKHLKPRHRTEKKKPATSTARKHALQNSRSNPKAAARVLLRDRGWSASQYTCLDSLWTRESGWNYQATNPSSGAYGIPQALPGRKMGASGSDWKTNPVTQMRWGLDYIADRYGSPCGAWSHSESHGWY